MSSYHNSFSYLGKNSKDDFSLIITHFADNADSGETDTFLSTSAVYSDSYDGTRQKFYGAKYDTVAEVQITVIKQDGTDFGIADNRKVLRWLTGSRQATWMDFYIDDEIKYRLLGRVKSVSQYKMDARIPGLILTFESVSPYGYSSLQTVSQSLTGTKTITVPCDSDELYSYVYMNTTYTNTSGSSLTITNNTTGDVTEVSGLAVNEVITISDNMVITSDKTSKTFGNNFNFVFPKLAAGDNELVVNGNGNITFEYIAPVKLGNIAIDINAVSDPICDDENQIVVDTLDWSRISNTPTTISGYGLSSDIASKYYNKTEIDKKIDNIYTKTEVDAKLENVVTDDVYTKTEIDAMFENLDIADTVDLSWDNITNKPTTVDGYGITDVYTTSDVYTKTEVDERLKNITTSGDGVQVDTLSWYKVVDTPTSISGYGITDAYTKTEVDEMLSATSVSIDADELNTMLAEVLV